MKIDKSIRSLAIILILSILFNLVPGFIYVSYAESDAEVREWWAYKFDEIRSYEYFSGGTYNNLISTVSRKPNYSNSILIPLRIPASGNKQARIDIVNSFSRPGTTGVYDDPGELYLDKIKYDYSQPVKHEYRIKYDNDKRMDYFPVWMIAEEELDQSISQEKTEELLTLYNEKKDTLRSLYNSIMRQGAPSKAGDYHPTHLSFLKSALDEWDYALTRGQDSKNGFSTKWNKEQVESLIHLMDEIPKYIESHRINETEILEFNADGYKGIIDKENRTIKLYIPEGVDLDTENVEIITPDWVIATFKSGQMKIGQEAKYSVKPIDVAYDGFRAVFKYNNLIEEWTVKTLLKNENNLEINSLNYSSEYGEKIDGTISGNSIKLNIPFQVDLNEIELNLYHTGQQAYAITDDQEIEIKDNKIKNPDMIKRIKIKTEGSERTYDFDVKSQSSSKNEILDFRITIDGIDHRADIDNEKNMIEMTVPFSTDITKLKTDIKLDHRATINPGKYEVQDFTNPVIYEVTSESGITKEYEVNIKRGTSSSENKILSFRVGTIYGTIEGDKISVEVPSTVNLNNIKPLIEISPYAKINPASSEGIDFSKGEVVYIVTAQNGEEMIYKVSITHSQGEAVGPDEEYMNMLKELRDNIYNKYKKEAVSEDWEWMNIGFYEGKDNGISDGIRRTAEDLPERFNMYNEIGELSGTRTTDLARFAMTLTVMGIDASDLEPFKIDGKDFSTDSGRPTGKTITNIIESLYNASGAGINGAIFSLIALDMGNYSIPGDANLSKDDLIKVLLNHEYGTDGFGIDMVAMLMQGLYPYQNHPIYGDAVKAKLEHGIELFLGTKSAITVDPLDKDFLGISWSAVNSESTSQVIIALCSMGIDPFSDYRFSRGPDDNMIVNWINKFVSSTMDGFGHTNSTNNFMGTYQGMYALQWYINFVENGGKPYSLYYDAAPFDFSSDFSDQSEITYFQLLGKEGDIDHVNGTITIELPIETTDEQLKTAPIINISDSASISPGIGEIQDFTKGISYTVTAEDGSTKSTYRIIIDKKEDVVSGEKDISSVTVEGFSNAKINIDKQNRRISIVLPSDTEESKLKNLVLNIDYKGRSIDPNPSQPQDFTKDVTYTITAEDGTTADFIVKVSIEEADKYEFTKFVLRGVEGEIDAISNEIRINLPFGTYVENIKPNEVEYYPEESGTSIAPAPTVLRTFEENNIYKIVPYPADNTVEYNVKINYVESKGNSEITKFSIGGYSGAINQNTNTITLTIPSGKTESQFKEELKDKVPDIEWPRTSSSIDPMPNGENNSLDDYLKNYVLSDKDGNVKLYDIRFTGGSSSPEDPEDEDNEIEITSFEVNGIKATIDNGNGIIYLEIPFEMTNYRVFPTIIASEGTSIYPDIRQSIDLRQNNVYTLKKGDEYKHYTLVVRRAEPKPATMLWWYMEEDLNIPYYQMVK